MELREHLYNARKSAGLKQREVAERCGIDDSSISAFEKGHREPRLGQLARLAEVYHLPLGYFFGESVPKNPPVLWRNKPDKQQEIEKEFLQLCHQYRQLEIWTGELDDISLPNSDNGKGRFWYPEVQELASDARQKMRLGDLPGESLCRVLEEVYYVKIFHMDIGNASIAACAVSDEFGEAILLNKNCSRWRRNHDLAHELFHLLTWNRFKHTEGICEHDEQEEKFATCFASNLLLPEEIIRNKINKAADEKGNISFSQLDKIAREFDVSLESLFWRMHFLFNWDESVTKEYIEHVKLYVASAPRSYDKDTPLFPERYRALAIQAFQAGEISLGQFAKFMDISRKEAEKYLTEREPDYAEVPISAS